MTLTNKCIYQGSPSIVYTQFTHLIIFFHTTTRMTCSNLNVSDYICCSPTAPSELFKITNVRLNDSLSFAFSRRAPLRCQPYTPQTRLLRCFVSKWTCGLKWLHWAHIKITLVTGGDLMGTLSEEQPHTPAIISFLRCKIHIQNVMYNSQI